MSHKHSNKSIRILKNVLSGAIMFAIGVYLGFILLTKDAKAFEDVAIEGADVYEWNGVFDDAALLFEQQGAMAILDLHGAIVRVIVYPELDCAQLFIDIPATGVSFMQCVDRRSIGATVEE